MLKLSLAPQNLKRLFLYSQAVAKGATEYEDDPALERYVTSEDQANLVSSATGHSDWHLPVLDIDVPHKLVPSTTEGHSHLYLDVPVRWDDYVELLHMLARIGVIEHGYASASIEKGATMVRKPGVLKQAA